MATFGSPNMGKEDDVLFEMQLRKNYARRAVDITILLLMVSLLLYRLVCLWSSHGGCSSSRGLDATAWLLAMGCEAWFTFVWVLVLNTKWNLLRYLTFPRQLLHREEELPGLDMFVTTADPELEPPIITVNTVLSLMAVDYPGAAHKLACYVSDDACSPLTFYALSEAARFAQLWVPFCRKYNIQVRAPFRYFSSTAELERPSSGGGSKSNSPEFQQEWKNMNNEYEKLSKKIEDASKHQTWYELPSDFTNIKRGDHPPIIKIIWENKEGKSDGLPHLIYISREKRPEHHHHYKAGAMNALIRVSGVMTNAPVMLNVDCDMYVNNPQVVLHALCILLHPESQSQTAYVQYPQKFYDGLKDDPFGNQFVVFYESIVRGMVSIQGPFYGGTGCFHRRKVIYGSWSENVDTNKKIAQESLEEFGSSKELLESVAHVLKGKSSIANNMSSSLDAAHQVASCNYEYGTVWGKKAGLIYGSTTEDMVTGMTLHAKGWRSAFCSPDPPGFLGSAPTEAPASLAQMKRWSTGFLEILVSRESSPIRATLFGKLQFRQCLVYMWILIWPIRSVPELVYALLPAYCIINNSHFLPKVQELAILIPAAIFIIHNTYTLSEYLSGGLSARAWWNNQRMHRINSASAWLFSSLSVLLKLLGISKTVFEITRKDQSTSGDEPDSELGRFTFDESPIFIPGTTLLLVQLAALAMLLLGLQPPPSDGGGSGLAEVVCALWVVLSFWPFLRGLLGKGKYGIPLKTIYRSAALAAVFVMFCRFTSIM